MNTCDLIEALAREVNWDADASLDLHRQRRLADLIRVHRDLATLRINCNFRVRRHQLVADWVCALALSCDKCAKQSRRVSSAILSAQRPLDFQLANLAWVDGYCDNRTLRRNFRVINKTCQNLEEVLANVLFAARSDCNLSRYFINCGDRWGSNCAVGSTTAEG